MKRLLLGLIMMLALPVVLADVSVMHSLEQKQDGLYVHAFVNTDSASRFDIGELIPADLKIENWTTTAKNVQFESTTGDFMGETYTVNHWMFNGPENDFEIVYRIPAAAQGIVSVWFYPNGFAMENVN